jgi:tetraacyldisaccharide 4'-kinase
VSAILRPLELAYRGLNRVRRALYRTGLLRAKRLPRPVISVGNIAVGGTGKTPAVIRIARLLTARGQRVAILTRGYGRKGAATGTVDSLDASKWGDEPVVIKKHLDNGDVIVGEYRYQNANQYLSNNDCDVFILDDGFQHLQLHRDFDVVIDVPDAPYLREGRSALRYADHVLLRGQTLHVTPRVNLAPGTPVFAFAGLADNEQFFQTLRTAGLRIIGTCGFPDHHRYTPGDIEWVRETAGRAGAAAIVTTEKDGVKIDQPDIIVIPAEAVIEGEGKLVEAILARIGR